MEYFNIQEMDLPENIWEPFARRHTAQPCRAGQLLYLQDTPADCFFYLCSGRVKTYISSEDGTEKVLTIYQAGNLFGEASFFDELPRVSSAIALTDCHVVRISQQDAARELAENPALARAMMKYLARTVRMLSTHVDDMAFQRADRRVIRYLLTLPRDGAGRVCCTQEEIAGAVSVSRVTVSRILGRLTREGLLRPGYGQITLLRPERLRQLWEGAGEADFL